MFYYSKKSHRKIVHTENCFIAQSFSSESIGTFATLAEAFQAGYRLCKRCNPIAQQYKKEQEDLLNYCYRNGMSCYYNDRNFKITSTISKWIVTVSPSGRTQLYHKNTKTLPSDEQSFVPGYHYQRVQYGSLMEYLEYIKEHDFYRNRHPEMLNKPKAQKAPPKKGTKRWYKEQAKLKAIERKRSIRNVLNIIDSFNSNYAVCEAV